MEIKIDIADVFIKRLEKILQEKNNIRPDYHWNLDMLIEVAIIHGIEDWEKRYNLESNCRSTY